MPIFAVEYRYTDATAAGRDTHRPAHREWLRGQVEVGAVLSSGPFADGSGALILIATPDLGAAEKLMANDPFLNEGVVDAFRIVEWVPVMGTFSE